MASITKYGSGGIAGTTTKVNNAFLGDRITTNAAFPVSRFMGKSKSENVRNLRIADEAVAINRYVWYNLPMDLTSQEVERMLYLRGQLAFWKCKDIFMLTPYALDGTIDFYGRFNTIHPVPMSSGTDESKEDKVREKVLGDIKLNVVKGIKLPDELTEDDLKNSAVILRDYTNQLSQTSIPRVTLQERIIDDEASVLQYMKGAAKNSTGVLGMRVQDATEADAVREANMTRDMAAEEGWSYQPIVGKQDFQELAPQPTMKAEEFLLIAQSLDNQRIGYYGLDNGGIFEKKAQELQVEATMAGNTVGLILQDGLSQRQNFCNIVNSIWGTYIWCEVAQNITGQDNDGDGLVSEDNSDSANTGVEANGEGEENHDDSNL